MAASNTKSGRAEAPEIDYRFSLANERTYLAWVRTSFALVAGGIVLAKALGFQHEWVRWLVAAPPIIGGAILSLEAAARWRSYERAMKTSSRLPVGRGVRLLASMLSVYALIALIAAVLDQ